MRVIISLVCNVKPFERVDAPLFLLERISVAITSVRWKILEDQHLLLVVLQRMIPKPVINLPCLERRIDGQSPVIANRDRAGA